MDPRGSAVVAIQPISAHYYTPPHFIKREGTSFGKKGRWNTGKYTWPRHNIFTLHSHALSVLRRHLMQKRQHLLYSIQLVYQTPVLQLFYKLTCNLNIRPLLVLLNGIHTSCTLQVPSHIISQFSILALWLFTICWIIPQCQSDHTTIFTPQPTAHCRIPQYQYHTAARANLVLYCFCETSSNKVSWMYGFDSRLIQSGSSNCFVECFRLDLIRL